MKNHEEHEVECACEEMGHDHEVGEGEELLAKILFLAVLGFIILFFLLWGRRLLLVDLGFGVAPVAIITLLGGYYIFRGAFLALKQRRLSMHVLVSVAILASVIAAKYFSGLTLAWLITLGQTLESLTIDRTRRAIRELVKLRPKTARVKRGGEEVEVPVEQVQLGEIVVIRPGERPRRWGCGFRAVPSRPVRRYWRVDARREVRRRLGLCWDYEHRWCLGGACG
ncbi:hypothetical protein DRO48_00140 [Candidatus Bathyarchaeota archaeon]|nr:MAG: hypothetical protein DRO48_00140 [Candidatus Bathyarchaeota archaeon]